MKRIAFFFFFLSLFELLFGVFPVSALNPFSSYLTGQPPEIVRDLGEEIQDGVKLRKVVFLSRKYEGVQGVDSALIFAVIARPEKPGNYPGLLVLHGGGGNAEIEKAKKWAAQGYIVVAPDEPGIANPQKIPFSTGAWNMLKYGENRFTVIPDITHSTIFDAVLASVQSMYLLHSQTDVVKGKIGIVGISWGGYLTTIVSGLAGQMVAASFSVYGCGFYDEGTTFLKELDKMTEEGRAVWLKYLDAGRYIKNVKTPFFIAAATNDNWFYPPAVMKTLQSASGYTNHLFAPNANHQAPLPGGTGDGGQLKPGWLKMEQDFFDFYLKKEGYPLPEIKDVKQAVITEKGASFLRIRFTVNSPTPITEASVYYSATNVEWTKRQWNKEAFLKKDKWYEVKLPLVQEIDWYITISDSRPTSVSNYITRQKK